MAIPSLTFNLVMPMLRHAAQLLPPSFRLQDWLMCVVFMILASLVSPLSFYSCTHKMLSVSVYIE